MEKAGWKSIPIGVKITEPGNSVKYTTGGWRTYRPVFHPENCINCLFCWIYCPDSCVIVKDGKMTGFNYDYCKGCGICAKECPAKVKAITMVLESECKIP